MGYKVRIGSSGAVRSTSSGAVASATRPQEAVKSSLVGTNILAIDYFGPVIPFVDLMRGASVWVNTQTFDDAETITADANGYVTALGGGQRVVSYICSANANDIADGTIFVYYTGDGASYGSGNDWWFDAQGGSIAVTSHDTDNKILELDVTFGQDSGQYLLLYINGIGAGGYLSQIAIVPSGVQTEYLAGETFHPTFLEGKYPFKCLRLMNWTQINNSTQNTWASRMPATYRCYGGSSWANATANAPAQMVPYEVQIELCNKVRADGWFHVPHLAGTAWWSALATLIHTNLDTNLHCYIERSNELWNNTFDQVDDDHDAGQTAYPGEPNIYYRGYYYSANQARLMFDDFEAVWTGADAARLHRVFAWQTNTSTVSNNIVEWESLEDQLDHWSIAPYAAGQSGGSASKLGTNPQAQTTPVSPHTVITQSMTTDDVFVALELDLTTNVVGNATTIAAMAVKGITCICYEAGQHLVGVSGVENDTVITALFTAVNRDERMEQWEYDYLTALKDDEGYILVMLFIDYYRPSKYGNWGLKEYQGQDAADAPKWRGCRRFIQDNAE